MGKVWVQGQALKGVSPETPPGNPYQAVVMGSVEEERGQKCICGCYPVFMMLELWMSLSQGWRDGKKTSSRTFSQHFTYVAAL